MLQIIMETGNEVEKSGCINLKSMLLGVVSNIMLRVDNWMARDLIKDFEDFANNPYRED